MTYFWLESVGVVVKEFKIIYFACLKTCIIKGRLGAKCENLGLPNFKNYCYKFIEEISDNCLIYHLELHVYLLMIIISIFSFLQYLW